MNSYGKAHLRPRSQGLLVWHTVGGPTPGATARAAGLCPRPARKRLARSPAQGLEGPKGRSSRPRRLRKPGPTTIVDQVAVLRQQWTGKQIAQLGISLATTSDLLNHFEPDRIAALKPAEPIRRYQPDKQAELNRIDIKTVGHFERLGHRIIGDKQNGASRGSGREFLQVWIEDASHLAFSRILSDERKESAVAVFRPAIACYANLGTIAARVMTDNCCSPRPLRAFRDAYHDIGLKHITTGRVSDDQDRAHHSRCASRMGICAGLSAPRSPRPTAQLLLHRRNWHAPDRPILKPAKHQLRLDLGQPAEDPEM